MDHHNKLAYAVKSLLKLHEEWLAFAEAKPYRVDYHQEDEPNSAGLKFPDVPSLATVRITGSEFEQPIEDFTHKFASVALDFRVALDYLAFTIARKQNPAFAADEKKAKKVQFPIVDDRAHWTPAVRRGIQEWAGAGALERIEWLQPFSRADYVTFDPLAFLNRMVNPAKHRNLVVVKPRLSNLRLEMALPFQMLHVEHIGLEGPFADGVVVARGKITSVDAIPFGMSIVNGIPVPFVFRNLGLKADLAMDFVDPIGGGFVNALQLLEQVWELLQYNAFVALDPFV